MCIKPHFKLNLGVEWHGIMRAARGWRFGAMIEYTPIKDQVVELELITVSLELYQENGDKTDPELIYNQIPGQSNYLQLKSFASWSPWNSSIFIRWSILWSPNRKETALTLDIIFKGIRLHHVFDESLYKTFMHCYFVFRIRSIFSLIILFSA